MAACVCWNIESDQKKKEEAHSLHSVPRSVRGTTVGKVVKATRNNEESTILRDNAAFRRKSRRMTVGSHNLRCIASCSRDARCSGILGDPGDNKVVNVMIVKKPSRVGRQAKEESAWQRHMHMSTQQLPLP